MNHFWKFFPTMFAHNTKITIFHQTHNCWQIWIIINNNKKTHTSRNTINRNELTESLNFPIANNGDFFSIPKLNARVCSSLIWEWIVSSHAENRRRQRADVQERIIENINGTRVCVARLWKCRSLTHDCITCITKGRENAFENVTRLLTCPMWRFNSSVLWSRIGLSKPQSPIL